MKPKPLKPKNPATTDLLKDPSFQNEVKALLEEKYLHYNQPDFIATDPIQIPHQFSKSEDIEISGFLAATIAWGQRKTIIDNAKKLIVRMDNAPFDFIMNAEKKDLLPFGTFVHRTFNGTDCQYFLESLKNIYLHHGGLKMVFEHGWMQHKSVPAAIQAFRQIFFSLPHPQRTEKHVSDITRGASAKRLNMFLRWMVRKDKRGVDFGIWDQIPSSALYLPLDLHTGNTSRKLGLLHRKANDWQAVEEITAQLRTFDPNDPVKYDFALFGLGIFEKL